MVDEGRVSVNKANRMSAAAAFSGIPTVLPASPVKDKKKKQSVAVSHFKSFTPKALDTVMRCTGS